LTGRWQGFRGASRYAIQLKGIGHVERQGARGITEEQVIRDVLLAAQPTKKFVQVEEVAAFASFLASDGAASITGAILPIEGGWTAH
jgi:3-hydroxybutyrate dehydrogenase